MQEKIFRFIGIHYSLSIYLSIYICIFSKIIKTVMGSLIPSTLLLLLLYNC